MIFKRLVALILCLLLGLGLLTISISVLADDAQEPAGVSYYINSLGDLLALAEACAGDSYSKGVTV